MLVSRNKYCDGDFLLSLILRLVKLTPECKSTYDKNRGFGNIEERNTALYQLENFYYLHYPRKKSIPRR